jgi:hypothetical protein
MVAPLVPPISKYKIFLEYFSTVGDRLSEFACLLYFLDKLF